MILWSTTPARCDITEMLSIADVETLQEVTATALCPDMRSEQRRKEKSLEIKILIKKFKRAAVVLIQLIRLQHQLK